MKFIAWQETQTSSKKLHKYFFGFLFWDHFPLAEELEIWLRVLIYLHPASLDIWGRNKVKKEAAHSLDSVEVVAWPRRGQTHVLSCGHLSFSSCSAAHSLEPSVPFRSYKSLWCCRSRGRKWTRIWLKAVRTLWTRTRFRARIPGDSADTREASPAEREVEVGPREWDSSGNNPADCRRVSTTSDLWGRGRGCWQLQPTNGKPFLQKWI